MNTPTLPLIDAAVTPHDWQARAFERLQASRPRLHDRTLDQALADAVLGRVIRAFAAQLQRNAEAAAKREARAARFGTPVQFNGFGYVPVHKPGSTR